MSAPDIVGYGYCRCGTLQPEIALKRSGGTCVDCETELFDAVREVEVDDDGCRYAIPIVRTRRRRRTPQKKQRTSTVQSARFAAMRRLKNLFPDLYQVLYAEERAKRGLEAFPVEGPTLDGDALESSLEVLKAS